MAWFEDDDTDSFDRTLSQRRLSDTGSFGDKRSQDRRQSNARIFFVTLVVIAVLYLAKPVVVPVALAILFAFLLTPVVTLLERSFLRRTGAIVISLGIVVASLSLGGYWIYQQFSEVAKELAHAASSGHIEEKIRFLRRNSGGTINVIERTLQRVSETGERPEKPDLKVRVIPERLTIEEQYKTYAPTIEFVASAFLVVVLVFFLMQ
ncbi:MAG TPA: AI-2E family transporter, partial [Thermoanaerobaculia bacterium]|nr:AI-2E family transporter [Thermoanaerobaculia bacterium]